MHMLKNKNFLMIYKVLFASLGISAIVTEIAVLANRGSFAPLNFFSFFTVQSNLFAAAILLASALSIKQLALWRGAATLYMVTTGIIFSVLLAGLDPAVLTAVPWDNVVLHYIMPIAVLVDWLIDPPKNHIPLKKALLWLLYPIVYVVYSLVRGHFVDWYPYPFLDPSENGYGGIAVTSIGIAAFVVLLTWLLIRFVPKNALFSK